MANLLSSRRGRSPISLEATEPQPDSSQDPTPSTGVPVYGWLLAAAGGALLTALAGWVLVAGLAVVGWLAADPGTLAQALRTGTELWLLGNGAGARLGGITITLVPWGVTALIGFMIARVAGFAARQSRDAPGAVVLAVTVVTTIAYLAPVIATALLLGQPLQAVRGATVMGVLVAGSAAWGCYRGLDRQPTERWPIWSRALPAAVLAAQLVLLAAGAALLVTATVRQLGRVEQLVAALDAGVAGNIALLGLQLGFAPNAVVWAASYALGAGFSLGPGSVVSPMATDLGVLPAVPILGALPAEGTGSPDQLWWLAAGVVAGAVAATVVVLSRRAARFDETALVGGLAGAVSGLVFTGLGWLSSGDLGVRRMVDLGPQLTSLLVMSTATMGLAGVATGLLLGLLRRRS